MKFTLTMHQALIRSERTTKTQKKRRNLATLRQKMNLRTNKKSKIQISNL